MNSRPNDDKRKQGIYDDALEGYRNLGFRLTEIDDHNLMLYHNSVLVGVVCQGDAVTPEQGANIIRLISDACREYLGQ